jgi:SAM-dependent methyltransferase
MTTYQIAAWSGPTGQTWAKLDAQLSRQLEPIGRAAMARAAPRAGERVIDIGCGAGATTAELAAAVGPTGEVTGVDVAHMLLDLARARAAGAANVTLIEADAQRHAFAAESFDLFYSRFGVMFFDDPPAAFANLRGASRPGGRLAFVCWRPPAENPWMSLPMAVADTLFPDRPRPDPEAPGPFAFAEEGRVRAILDAAGWRHVAIEPLDIEIGGADLQASVQLMLRVGPLGFVLREAGATAELMGRADALLRPAVAAHETAQGVMFPSATWVVTAQA